MISQQLVIVTVIELALPKSVSLSECLLLVIGKPVVVGCVDSVHGE